MSVVRFRPEAPFTPAGVAQLAEQLICNQQVAGSSPITSSKCGEIPEWLKGADCKSAGDAFDGSNPSLSTNFADMAELADAHGSGPCEGNFMEVQVLLSAPCRGGFRDQEPVRQSERVLNFVLGMTSVAVFVRISIFNSVTAFRYYSNY